MLIHIGNNGQIGNSFLSLIHVIANAIEYNYPLKSYSVCHYGKLFGEVLIKNNINIVWHKSFFLSKKSFIKLAQISTKSSTNLANLHLFSDNDDLVKKRKSSEMVKCKNGYWIYCGWCFRDHKSLNKHQDTVRQMIGISLDINTRNKHIENDSYKIGVHIRRGDYKNWNNGIYFFDDYTYINACKQAAEAKKGLNRKINFHLFSQQTLSLPGSIADSDVTDKSSVDPVRDLIGLSQCDLIIGPPSTFSMLASFIGNVPIVSIENSDFEYKNGSELTYLESGLKNEKLLAT
jgi:hypothetical protein